jgi:hypothetical protein
MTEFNPATMNPASIILQENNINSINNIDYYDYIIVFIIIIMCIFIYLNSNKKN